MVAKAADAFRTISEVSGWLDTPAHVLRFWESKFAQIKPVKRAGGRRYYRPEDMVLLGGIKVLLHEQGMTIKGVQKLLREKGTRHVAALSPPLGQFDGAGEMVELEPGEDLTVLDGPEPAADVMDDPISTLVAMAGRGSGGPKPQAQHAPPPPALIPSRSAVQPLPVPLTAPGDAADTAPPAPDPAVVFSLPPLARPSPVPEGLLSQLLAADTARLRGRARRIAPHLARLEAVAQRMAGAAR